jgi:hypothetical protein
VSTFIDSRDALLTLCRAYSGGTVFTTANSDANDYTVLNTDATHALLIARSAPSIEADEIDGYGSHGARQERHTFAVWVFTTIGTGDEGVGAIVEENEVLLEALRDHLRPYRTLDDAPNVRDMRLTETMLPERNNTGTHIMQSFTVVVDCEVEG